MVLNHWSWESPGAGEFEMHVCGGTVPVLSDQRKDGKLMTLITENIRIPPDSAWEERSLQENSKNLGIFFTPGEILPRVSLGCACARG